MPSPRTAVPTQIIPYIFYRKVDAALGWLAAAFGFVETLRHATPSGGVHAEMTLDGQVVMMGQSASSPNLARGLEERISSMGVFVWIADVDGHHATAQAAGAEIVHPPMDQSYGRTYAARDLDGHAWFFATPWQDG